MTKRFRKVMGFIQDNKCENGDMDGVMDLTEIENMLNQLNNEKEHYHKQLEAIQNVMKDFDRGYDTYNGVEMFNALSNILKILNEEEDTL